MIFENINQTNQPDNKKIQKHISLNPEAVINLNAIQTAYKVETNEHINLNDLIAISINVLVKLIKNEIANNSELEAIKYLTKLKKELE
ncbi:MAG: hypothetical protein IJH39_06330 [Clostridia bacterium]|nr:hypothetical protein [Clostridia bacterium]